MKKKFTKAYKKMMKEHRKALKDYTKTCLPWNQQGLELLITYLECVLIATIYLSIKAAKRIPKCDKDYIIT